MKKEPLKGKRRFANQIDKDKEYGYTSPVYFEGDIKSAIIWLEEQMFKNDDITPISFRVSKKLIDKAFEDVRTK